MSKSQAADTIHMPEIRTLTCENVAAFMQGRQRPLSAEKTKAVAAYLNSDGKAIELNHVLEDVLKAYTHFDDLAGLSKKETEKLKQLANIRQEFKKSHKQGEYDGPGFKHFIANERKIVAFNQSVQWWQQNIETLRKLSLWEKFDNVIMNSAKDQHLPESELKQRLYKLNDIKHEWAKHQMFGAFSSDHLLEFHQNYLCVAEEVIKKALVKNKDCPAPIVEYLNHTLSNIKDLHRQSIYSMLMRLICISVNNDIECDDLLRYYIVKIEKECQISINKNGVRPDARKGLNPDVICLFMHEITRYIQSNPEDKEIENLFLELECVKKPHRWTQYHKEIIEKSTLAANPITVFSANNIYSLISKAATQKSIHLDILTSDIVNSDEFILHKINHLLYLTSKTVADNALKSKNELDQEIINDIDAWNNSYEKIIKDTYLRMSIEIRNNIQKCVANVFSSERIDYVLLNQLSEYIIRSDEFDELYLHKTYDPDKDIILALSAKLKQCIEKGELVTNEMLDKIRYILNMKYHGKKKNINDDLSHLSEQIKNIHVNDDAYIMHYITQHLEIAYIGNDNIASSLMRHQYITELYDEKDNPLRNIKVEYDHKSCDLHSFANYIKYIFIPLIHESPSINLNNFDDNNMFYNILKPDKNTFQLVKNQFEIEIFRKINNLFDIKRYIYSENEMNIDLEKLQGLIQRINNFFTDANHRTSILLTITNAYYALIKNYVIRCIENDKTPDFTSLQVINRLLKKDILSDIALDNDIESLLKNYINLYNGSNNHLGAFIQNEVISTIFSKQRTNYINLSHQACKNDYYFFEQHKSNHEIQSHFQSSKKIHQDLIHEWIMSASSWNNERAYIIELFGNADDVDKYRFKFIKEVLSNPLYNHAGDEVIDATFSQFMDTVNPYKSDYPTIVNPKNILINKMNLSMYLDYAISHKPWNLMIEKVVTACGSEKQLQDLHYQHISKCLTHNTNISNSLIDKKLSNIATTSNDTPAGQRKIAYSQLIGEKNIIRLCAQIEKHLDTLQTIESQISNNHLNDTSYQLYISIINSLKPLQHLYFAFSSNPSYNSIMRDLTDMEKRLELHRVLYHSIQDQTSLLSITGNNSNLHHVILTITKSINELNDCHSITGKTTSNYIQFCNDKILSQINGLLNSNNPLSVPALMRLSDLIHQIPSDHLKLLLSHEYKHECLQQPIWLTLINHLDEKHGLETVTKYLSNMENADTLGSCFTHLLGFSKNLINTKQQIHQKITSTLLDNAQINLHTNNPVDLDNVFKSGALSEMQLLNLWQSCLEMLHPKQNHTSATSHSLRYIVKLSLKVGEELLKRSRYDNQLSVKFMETYYHFSKSIYSACNNIKHNSTTNHAAFWEAASDKETLLAPFTKLMKRVAVGQILNKLDKFIIKKSTKNGLLAFQEIINHPEAFNPNMSIDQLIKKFKDNSQVKDDHIALALAHTMSLYFQAQEYMRLPQSQTDIGKSINVLATNIAHHATLANISGFQKLIRSLQNIINEAPEPAANDAKQSASTAPMI